MATGDTTFRDDVMSTVSVLVSFDGVDSVENSAVDITLTVTSGGEANSF